jgi:uncharacterized protein YutE (UPF0331/DUF86 family)
MTPDHIDHKVVTQRAAWIREMMGALADLPLKNKGKFLRNRHNAAAAESYLRRSLEALFDIGRHVLAKRFASPTTEYKEIAKGLLDKKILNEDEAELMRKMAGYRNRMVHFYHEIPPDELHEICLNHLDEIKLLLDRMLDSIGRKE